MTSESLAYLSRSSCVSQESRLESGWMCLNTTPTQPPNQATCVSCEPLPCPSSHWLSGWCVESIHLCVDDTPLWYTSQCHTMWSCVSSPPMWTKWHDVTTSPLVHYHPFFLLSSTKHGAVWCVWSHHAFCIHSLCDMVNHHHTMIGSWWLWFIHQINANALKQCGDMLLWCLVVPVFVWIAWWACVDALFHILFNTRPSMVVSDACQCVFHTQITTKHSVVQLVPHLSTLHIANHQQHHAFLRATHASLSRFFHNCPSFFSVSSSSSSFF